MYSNGSYPQERTKMTSHTAADLVDEEEAQRCALRRERLNQLINDHFFGEGSKLAQRTGLNQSLISQYRTGKRPISPRTTEVIEKTLSMHGYFSVADVGALSVVHFPTITSEAEATLIHDYRKLDSLEQRRINGDRAFIGQIGLGRRRAVDFGLEEGEEHGDTNGTLDYDVFSIR